MDKQTAVPQVQHGQTNGYSLQRQCACGQHTIGGGECEECQKKKGELLQRAAVRSTPPVSRADVSMVRETPNSPGQALDQSTRAFMDQRFSYDFSAVRVHTNEQAAESAQSVHALAYTVGQDIVFGRGQYTPGTLEGKKLLAHELTHVVQQTPQLHQGQHFSHAIAEREAKQIAEHIISGQTTPVKPHAVSTSLQRQEIQPVPNDDAASAILAVTKSERTTMQIKVWETVWRIIGQYYRADGNVVRGVEYVPELIGLQTELAGVPGRISGTIKVGDDFIKKLTISTFAQSVLAVGKQIEIIRKADPGRKDQAAAADKCALKYPERCPTYEEWLNTFFFIGEKFTARDTAPGGGHTSGQQVLGKGPAEVNPGKETEETRPPLTNEPEVEHFIDHPTNAWITEHMPDELRETAYLLPADCADIAVILRHVWLYYHHRTETFRGWTVGTGAEKTAGERHERIKKAITQKVSAATVPEMVNAYSEGGKPVRSFQKLKKLLHPGDILVWEHHISAKSNVPRGIGHTHTITQVFRNQGGEAIGLSLVQGNQPVDREAAEEILHFEGQKHPTKEEVDPRRAAPGRRIEESLEQVGEPFSMLQDLPQPIGAKKAENVWSWGDEENTTLVVAGPPASAIRQQKTKKSPTPTLGTLADWLPLLDHASMEGLQGTFEAALQATRAMIEGGTAVPDADATALGEKTVQRLQGLAVRGAGARGAFDAASLFRDMQAALVVLGKLNRPSDSRLPYIESTRRVFDLIRSAMQQQWEINNAPVKK